MADYKQTLFIIEFINGKMKRFDDDRFKLEIAEDGKSAKVYSRITQEVALDVPNMEHVLYIHYNILKKQYGNNTQQKTEEPFNPVPVNDFEEPVEE